MTRFTARLKALPRDNSGTILPMAAASIVVMLALVGGGFEMSRAYRVQNRLQNACDSAVLAGRRAVTNNGFDTVAQTQANRYFNVNFDQTIQGTRETTATFEPDSRANSISGSASTTMPLLLMQIFGKTAMTIEANCESTMGVGNSDVMMVLDTTGSMGFTLGSGTRLAALQTAMKNFYTTLATSTSGTNARVRYGFVPFSSSVNVGSLLYQRDPSFLADSATIQSREAKFNTVVTQVFDGWSTPVNSSSTAYSSVTNGSNVQFSSTNYSTLSACNNASPTGTTAWSNNGGPTTGSPTVTTVGTPPNTQQIVTTTTTQPQTMRTYLCLQSGSRYRKFYYTSSRNFLTYNYATSNGIYRTETNIVFSHWEYKPVTYDTSSFKAFQSVSTNTGSNGAAISSTWTGCIEERATTPTSSFSYSTITGMSPSDAADLDLDSEPSSDPASKWTPMWHQVSYLRNSLGVVTRSDNQSVLNSSQPSAPSTPYCGRAAQLLQPMTQGAFNAYADSLVATGATYLDIGMIWGGRLISQEGIFADNVNESPANGGNVSRHLIFMTDGQMDTSNGVHQAYGIEWLDRKITTDGSKTQDDARHSLRFRAVCDAVKAKGVRIWVIAFTSGLNADLNYCTSPSSAFTANTSAQLNTAFQEIAKQVGELRVLQ